MEIQLQVKNYRCFPEDAPARFELQPGFTALVGPNNSGKSSLLRLFFEFREVFRRLKNDISGVLSEGTIGFNFPAPIADPAELFSNSNDHDLVIQMRLPKNDSYAESLQLTDLNIVIPRNMSQFQVTTNLPESVGTQLREGQLSLDSSSMQFRARSDVVVDYSALGEAVDLLTSSLYVGPFRNAINIGAEQNYYDIQTGQAFIRMWRQWKTGPLRRQNERLLKLTEDIRQIFGFEQLEINESEEVTTLQLVVDGRSYRLRDLGAGLTQFILVLANAAISEPSYVLIDEPELNLHPTLQMDFLTTLASYAREGIVFATHSIGLARASADEVYSAHLVRKGVSELKSLEETSRPSEFLGELGFSGYRELGFDGVLLVEGVRDVKTIQQFLRKLRKDHEIVILPLGGGALITGDREQELVEMTRLSGRICALIDSERTGPDDRLERSRQDFVELCEKIGIRCHVSDLRALENYLPDSAVKSVKGPKYQGLGPYQTLSDVDPQWGKHENWRIAREMSREEVLSSDVGKFLNDI